MGGDGGLHGVGKTLQDFAPARGRDVEESPHFAQGGVPAQRQAVIAGSGQSGGGGTRGVEIVRAEIGVQPFRQSGIFQPCGDGSGQDGGAGERRAGEEFRAGDEHHRVQRQIGVERAGREARLAGIHHNVERGTELRAQLREEGRAWGQDAGFGEIEPVQDDAAPLPYCGQDGGGDVGFDVRNWARGAGWVAERDVGELGVRAEAGDRGFEGDIMAKGGIDREMQAARGHRHAAPGFLRGDEDVGDGRSAVRKVR